MDIEEIRTHCLQKPWVTEGFPFDEDTLVFKAGGKMFLLISLDKSNSISVKCDPELAAELRESYTEVQPGYHLSKKHWNTVDTSGSLTRSQLCEMIDHSYNLVIKSLPKKVRETLANG